MDPSWDFMFKAIMVTALEKDLPVSVHGSGRGQTVYLGRFEVPARGSRHRGTPGLEVSAK